MPFSITWQWWEIAQRTSLVPQCPVAFQRSAMNWVVVGSLLYPMIPLSALLYTSFCLTYPSLFQFFDVLLLLLPVELILS